VFEPAVKNSLDYLKGGGDVIVHRPPAADHTPTRRSVGRIHVQLVLRVGSTKASKATSGVQSSDRSTVRS